MEHRHLNDSLSFDTLADRPIRQTMDISETLLVIDAGNGNERGRTSSTEGQAGSASSGSPSPMNHDFTHTVKNELRLMNRGIAEMNKAVLDLIREMLVSHQRFQKCNEENSQAIVGLTASTNGLKLLIVRTIF